MTTAEEYIKKANKEINSRKNIFSKFLSFRNDQDRLQEIAELYSKAGLLFKIKKDNISAKNAFISSAKYFESCGDIQNAALKFEDAAKLCNSEDDEYITLLKNACSLSIKHCTTYSFVVAARIHQTIAEEYKRRGDNKKAIYWYRFAFEYYESNQSKKNHCMEKLAELFITERSDEAVECYKYLIESTDIDTINRYRIFNYCMMVIVYYLSIDDLESAKTYEKKYSEDFYIWNSSRESRFCKDLINCVYSFDLELFTSICVDYNFFCRMESSLVDLLLRIKQQVVALK
jgi:tetratricopeptide (TPR) repeat protein